MSGMRVPRLLLIAALTSGCAAPVLSQDGQLVFAERGGRRGASVLTANGIMFMDESELPRAVEKRSASEPWRAPTGFLLPRDGVWRHTSKPVPIEGHGLGVVLRASDVLVPAWGGEILLRFDAVAPAAAFPTAATREPVLFAIVLDARDANAAQLASVALDGLGEKDRATLIDASAFGAKGAEKARTVVPLVPGRHRSLIAAAVEQVTSEPPSAKRDLAGALALARTWIQAGRARARVGAEPRAAMAARVLVLCDGGGASDKTIASEVTALAKEGAHVTAIGTVDEVSADALAALGPDIVAGAPFSERENAIARLVPPPGDLVLSNVTLSIASAPAPSRFIELSGGDIGLSLDHDRVELGDLYAGEARTEVARVAVPDWVAGEPLEITVRAAYVDRRSGSPLAAEASLRLRYSEDIEAMASSRHGDVIAYASGLAMVRRLRRAFAGSEIDRLGGLRPIVAWQADSLASLARASGDAALGEQAEILKTLLAAVHD
jgi:hypothetical protein